jgi:hypothetical protein
MHILFIDEFGHERPNGPNQIPVFGYGGFVMPAENFSKFSTQFFDLKVFSLKNIYRHRYVQNLQQNSRFQQYKNPERVKRIVEKLERLPAAELLKDADVRRLAAQYEIKGSEVFSPTYAKKINNSDATPSGKKRQLNRYFRYAKVFLRLIRENGGEIYFKGYYKTHEPRFAPDKKVHVELVRDVLDAAFAVAQERRSTVTVVFDHHYTDIGESFGPNGRRVAGLVNKTRGQRAHEVMLTNAYYENLTEPIFNARSHLSQGVQAADWVCTLLKYFLLFHVEQGPEQQEMYDALKDDLLAAVSTQSSFASPRPLDQAFRGVQTSLFLQGGHSQNRFPDRPYRDGS